MTAPGARRVLVTGAGGFVGGHLMPRLVAAGYAVTGTSLGRKPATAPAEVEWRTLDLLEPSGAARLGGGWWAVIHLAANSIPQRHAAAGDALRNVAMTLELLGGLEPCRLLLVSSCHVYSPSARAISESDATRPRGSYGLSKLLCEQAALAFADRLDVRIARPFNHLGVGLDPALVVPSLIRRLREEGDTSAPLRMRGRNSVRDFTDVADVVAAYQRLIELDDPGERVFNVASGAPRSIGEVAAALLRVAGRRRPVEFEEVPLSGDDTPTLLGDPARLEAATGWRATQPLEATLAAMWRAAQA
jgi:GDP-4-dehydro-6-deoxy-D-mannose reductase